MEQRTSHESVCERVAALCPLNDVPRQRFFERVLHAISMPLAQAARIESFARRGRLLEQLQRLAVEAGQPLADDGGRRVGGDDLLG